MYAATWTNHSQKTEVSSLYREKNEAGGAGGVGDEGRKVWVGWGGEMRVGRCGWGGR